MKLVLLVDDESDIREVASLALETIAGWTVQTASSGQEALRVAALVAPDAIVMDVAMPGMDGPTTVGRLRANPETDGIPIVLLTAKAQAAELARLRALGVAGVIRKPFDPMTLQKQIMEILGWDDEDGTR